MRYLLIIASLVVSNALCVGAIIEVRSPNTEFSGYETCSAPCRVIFDDPIAEDTFDFDYSGRGELYVWQCEPGKAVDPNTNDCEIGK